MQNSTSQKVWMCWFIYLISAYSHILSLAFNWLDGLYFVIVIPICIPKLELWDEAKAMFPSYIWEQGYKKTYIPGIRGIFPSLD